MGRTVGVIHATGEPGVVADDLVVQDLQTLANQAGARLGMHRIMAETQLQAATDNLTGLLNRRSLENQVRVLRNDRVSVHGRDGGPRPLQGAERHLRPRDRRPGPPPVRRHAPELAPRTRTWSAVTAARSSRSCCPTARWPTPAQTLDGVRGELADALRAAGLPRYTASFGVIEADPNEDFEAAVRRADTALFEAKHHGRDRVVAHDGTGTTLNGAGAKPRANGRPRRRVARTAPLRAH